MENTRDLLGELHLGGDGNRMDLLWVGWREILLKEMTGKKRHLGIRKKSDAKDTPTNLQGLTQVRLLAVEDT